MKEQAFILGSSSPRRSEILDLVGIKFDIIPSTREEVITKKKPQDIVEELSLQKALDVKGQVLCSKKYEDVLILCADTMVAFKNRILGKPKDEAEAREMLTLLQNNKHSVYTGVTIISIQDGEEKMQTFHVATKVFMDKMDAKEIEKYINTGECLDKAGSYAIQGYGAKYIGKIIGDYYNVMGLPIEKVYVKLKNEFE